MAQAGLSYQVALALFRRIDKFTIADFDSLGITPADFEITCGENLWRRDYIPRVMRTIQALIFGTLETLGQPKMNVPTEYVAAVLTAFVKPGNLMAACQWLEQEQRLHFAASDLADAESAQEVQPTNHQKCFALICQLIESGDNGAAQRWHEAMGLAYNNQMENAA